MEPSGSILCIVQLLKASQSWIGRILPADRSNVPIILTILVSTLNSETRLQERRYLVPVLAQQHRRFLHSEWSAWLPNQANPHHWAQVSD